MAKTCKNSIKKQHSNILIHIIPNKESSNNLPAECRCLFGTKVQVFLGGGIVPRQVTGCWTFFDIEKIKEWCLNDERNRNSVLVVSKIFLGFSILTVTK